MINTRETACQYTQSNICNTQMLQIRVDFILVIMNEYLCRPILNSSRVNGLEHVTLTRETFYHVKKFGRVFDSI